MKIESQAKVFKENGNEFYLDSQFTDAIIAYNEALCHAESDELKSLLYGNRSAVFYEVKRYSLCVENIQLAIKHGYPQEKMVNLKARVKKCKQLLSAGEDVKENDQKVANFFKLSYESHPKIPFIIDGIELKNSEKYGNHLITNRDLKTGDIIAVEPLTTLFGSLGNRYCYEKCAFCLRHNFFSLIPCDECNNTMYCSDLCKEQHKEIFHTMFCNKRLPMNPKSGWVEIPLRIINTALKEIGFEEFKKLVENPQKMTIFDVDELSPKYLLKIFCSMVRSESSLDNYSMNVSSLCAMLEKSHEFRDLLLQVVATFSTNAMSFHRCHEGEMLSMFNTYGESVLVFGSYFNHSCNPNIDRVTLDDKIVFYVNRPIKAGEQLFITYGPVFESSPLEVRQDLLMRYEFVCECDACKNNYPVADYLRKLQKKNPPPNISSIEMAIEMFKGNCKIINEFQKDPNITAGLIDLNDIILNEIATVSL